MLTIAAYCRVSTTEQVDQGLSIPSQQDRIRSFIKSQGAELFDFYIDDGFSGKDLNRPCIQQLIKDSHAKKFDAVYVVRLDRLSRSQRDVMTLLEDVFNRNNIGFKSVTEPFDTTSPFGKAAIGMMSVFAQLEREQIAERIKDAKKEAAKQGRHIGGPAPIGYKFVPETKVTQIDELRADVVRQIYKMYIGGHGLQAIADTLNTNKIPPPNISPDWQRMVIKKILKNPYYIGKIVHKGIVYDGQHEGLIPTDEWEIAQQTREIRSSRIKQPDRPGLLTGFIFCGECGRRMYKKTSLQDWYNKRGEVVHYICSGQREKSGCTCGYKRADVLEYDVIQTLKNLQFDMRSLKSIAKEMIDAADSNISKSLLAKNLKERDKLKNKSDKLYTAYMNDAMTLKEYSERNNDLRDYRISLDSKIEELENDIKAAANKHIEVDAIMDVLKNFDQLWEVADFNERRLLLSEILKIRVFKDSSFKIDFSHDQT